MTSIQSHLPQSSRDQCPAGRCQIFSRYVCSSKKFAFCRRPVIAKSAAVQELLPGMLDGKVVRMCTSEQQDHFGLIQTGSDETNAASYAYGVANLVDKREVLQKGDSVRFQLASVRSSGSRIATNVAPSHRFLRARVDAIKGQVFAVFAMGCGRWKKLIKVG